MANAKIKRIYSDATRTTQVYPQTHEKAVIDNNGVTLESKFDTIVDLVNQAQMEVGAVPTDLTPAVGNTTHVATSDGIARELYGIQTVYDGYTDGKYYNCGRKIGTTISQEPSTLSGWKCIAIPVVKGDRFELYGYNGYSARLWCFVDEDWKVIDSCQGLLQTKTENVTAPSNGFLLSSIPSSQSTTGYVEDTYIYKFKSNLPITNEETLHQDVEYCVDGITWKGQIGVAANVTILDGFGVVKGHRYLLYLKSDAIISESTSLTFGMGSNNTFDYTVTPQQILDGVAITKTCGTEAASSRIYSTLTTWKYGVNLYVKLIDEDEPDLFPQKEIKKGDFLTTHNVVDNLDSTDSDKPLSAKQGKELKGLVANAESKVDGKVGYVMKSDKITEGRYQEVYIRNINIVEGHKYRIYAKSEEPIFDTETREVRVIVSQNGQIYIGTVADIVNGVYNDFTATQTGAKIMYQYSPETILANKRIHFEIKDLTEPSSIGPFNVESSVVDRALAYARTEGIPEEACNWKILWTRSLANNMLSFSGFQPTTYNNGIGYQQYASMTNYLTLPYRGVRIYLKAPDDITARVIFRPWDNSSAALSSTTIGDGEYVDADADAVRYIVEFYRRGECVPPQELYDYMDEGLLMLYYHDDSGNVVVRNSDEMRYVNAIRGDGEVVRDYATFVHGTDVHGDEVRLNNILRFANLIKPTATLLSGDHVAVSFYDGIDFFNECLEKWRYANPFICIGNHDSNDVANDRVFAAHVEPLAEKFGWMKDAENVTDSCWFYKDITDKKIRLISLDMYEYGGTTFYKVFMQQAQIDWFIETLQSVPEDYAVLIVQHSMERQAVAIEGKEEWWGTGNLDYGGITGGYVIQDIMDAWIGKTTIDKTYSQPMKGGATNTFTAEADFSEDLANEFIGYVSGHTHVDCIGYADGTVYRQLIMCCTCACPWRGQTGRVYPRGLQGVTQDSFNVYAVDRTNKQVRIAKVGSNMKMDFTETKYTIVDYENVEN